MGRVSLAALVIAVLLTGCGGGSPSPEEQVRTTAEEFAVAIGVKDYEKVCALFTPALRDEYSYDDIQADCPDYAGPGALGNPAYDGLTVANVAVDDTVANVTFEGSPVSLELVEADGEWQISALR